MALENSYIIDWLSFTCKMGNPFEVIELAGLGKLNFTENERGRYGYDNAYTLDGIINVFYSAKRSDMGVHVEMTGQGVRKYEAIMEVEGITWAQVFEHLRSFATFSRIDLALDEYEGMVGFADIIGKIERGEHVGRCRSFKVISGRGSNGEHTGTTIYMGSNKSDIMLRVYEKNYERQAKGYEIDVPIWNRWELVLKHEKANDFVARYLDGGYSFGRLFGGILADLIRFVEPGEDTNKSRWQTCSWWSDFLAMADPIQLKGKEYQPNLAKTLNWVENSTITAIKGLSAIAKEKNVDFLQLLMASQSGNHDKIGKMKQEFDGMSSKE
ncbi:TPA: replication initiation factor domain-containing protein, partial [Streptococcus pyogenes]